MESKVYKLQPCSSLATWIRLVPKNPTATLVILDITFIHKASNYSNFKVQNKANGSILFLPTDMSIVEPQNDK